MSLQFYSLGMASSTDDPADSSRHGVAAWEHRPGRDVKIDAQLLRALAHPLRGQIVSALRRHGSATATQLAERLNVNSGATSYHLRQLAEAGLVAEDTARGNARDRWWKSVHESSYFNDLDLAQAEPELTNAFLHSIARSYADNMFRSIDQAETLPREWLEINDMSDFVFQLTSDQAKQLRDELYEVLARYRTERSGPHPEGTRPVGVQLQMFPRNDD